MTQELRKVGGGAFVIGGRLWTIITNLIPLASYGDEVVSLIPLLSEWNAITDAVSTPAGLKARLAVIVKAGKVLSAATPNTTDDALVSSLESVASNDTVINFVAGLLAANPGASPATLVELLEVGPNAQSLTQAATESQIDLAKIIEAIKMIIALIGYLQGLFPGTTTPTTGTTPAASGDSTFDFVKE